MYIYSQFSSSPLEYSKKLASDVDYCFSIIGSAGNGKNYLMRKIGNYFSDSTYFFCSFDAESIDGVLIKNKVLLFDGSYPHNILPTLYKVNGEVVNLGDTVDKQVDKVNILGFYDKEKRAKYEYSKYGYIYSNLLKTEYDYLDSLYLDEVDIVLRELENKVKTSGTSSIISDVYYKMGKTKNTNYSINSNNKFYAKYVLSKLNERLNDRKIKHITYHNMFNENFIEGIGFEDIYIGNNLAYGENINIYGENIVDFVNYPILEAKIAKLKKEAVYLHKKLERQYKPLINFERNEDIYEMLISKIKAILY